MNKRITNTLENNIEAELREIQAKKISTLNKSISFSYIINEVLQKGLENSKK